jgi:hypothetical protein
MECNRNSDYVGVTLLTDDQSMSFEVMISLPLKLIVLARLLRAQSDDAQHLASVLLLAWLGYFVPSKDA